MGRAGITVVQVQKAMERLKAKGVYPSLNRVVAEIGGSKSTVSQLMAEIRSKTDQSEVTTTALVDELTELNTQIIERIRASVERECNELKVKFDESNRAWAEYKEVSEANVHSLNSKLNELTASLEAKDAIIFELNNKLENQAKELELTMNRAGYLEQQVISLEDKYTRSIDQMNHFRDRAKEQRDEDIRLHQDQVRGLQNEIRLLKQTNATKQSELIELNKELGRLNSINANHVKVQKDAEKTIHHYVNQNEAKTAEIASLIGKMEVLTDDLNKSKQNVNLIMSENFEIKYQLMSKLALIDELNQLLSKTNAM